MAKTRADYRGELKPVWCPGCGDYGVLAALQDASASRQLEPTNTVVVSGIGCSGRFSGFYKAYGFHGVHGRALPTALGVKLANPDLNVVVAGGDGDGFSIGAGHVPHAARRNPNMTYLIMDNSIYGLTKGQTSPTSPLGLVKDNVPYGEQAEAVNIAAMCLAYDVSFFARGFSGQPRQLAELIGKALDHKGFAIVQALSPCPTFYDTYDDWRSRIVDLPEDHDPTDKMAALQQAYRTDAIPLGVFYQVERPTYEEQLANVRQTAMSRGPVNLDGLFNKYAQ